MMNTKTCEYIFRQNIKIERTWASLAPGTQLLPLIINLSHSLRVFSRETRKS